MTKEERHTKLSLIVLKIITLVLAVSFVAAIVVACNMSIEQEKVANATFSVNSWAAVFQLHQ